MFLESFIFFIILDCFQDGFTREIHFVCNSRYKNCRLKWEVSKRSGRRILTTIAILEDVNGNPIEVPVKLEKRDDINCEYYMTVGADEKNLKNESYPLVREFGRYMFLDDIRK